MIDIPRYEGRYAVTEDGKIWSYPRWCKGRTKFRPSPDWWKEGNFVKGLSKHGYLQVCLRDENGKSHFFSIHRLVAKAYIPKVDGKHHVNHLNNDRADNRVENLEWCTPKENIHYAIKNFGWTRKGKNNGRYIHGNRVNNNLEGVQV